MPPPLAWARAKACLVANTALPFTNGGSTHEQDSPHCRKAQHLPDRYRPDHSQPQSWRDSLGKALEDSSLPRMPLPRNFRTDKPYRGVNILLLWSSPYSSPFWLTFKQALDLKGAVRKGEKGTPIVFYKQLQNRKDDQRATDERKERIPFVLSYYTVL